MIQNIRTSVAPDSVQVAAWASRLRMQKNVAAAREMLFHLKGKFPDDDVIASLMEWHRPEWWQDLSFGGIRLVRRTPEHFEFVWSVILNEEFSKKGWSGDPVQKHGPAPHWRQPKWIRWRPTAPRHRKSHRRRGFLPDATA